MDADYYIIAVRKDEYERITYLKTLNGLIKSRADVVNDIDSCGKSVMTAFLKPDGKYYKGAEVHVYKHKWLRTDQNQIEADNLDNLPAF